MNASRWRISLLLWMMLLWSMPLSAQTAENPRLSEGVIVGGAFTSVDAPPQSWQFDATLGEIIAVRVARIGGVFVPRLRLIAPDGQMITAFEDNRDDHSQQIVIRDGLPQTGTYRLEISQQSATFDGVLTQNEYSLMLERRGQIVNDVSTLSEYPLPAFDVDDLPDYFTGTPTAGFLDMAVFGDATRADPFTLITDTRRVVVDNTNVLARIISDLALIDATGEIALRTNSGAVLITETNIDRLAVEGAIITLALADGRTFSTDFYQVASVRIETDGVAVRLRDGQRLLLEGERISLTRRGGFTGEGPNAEPIFMLTVDETQLVTDGDGWHTLAQASGQLTVIYDAGFALISEVQSGSLLRRGNLARPELNAPLTDTRLLDVQLNDAQEQTLTLTLDPHSLADVRVSDTVRLRFLDGREANESRAELRDIITDTGAVRFERIDGTLFTLLPDNTRFIMPTVPDTLPQHFANWGTTINDYFPQVDFDFALMPINRANGNFVYPVQDEAVAGTAPALNWSRTYNSLAPANQTPDYMRDAPRYLHFGQGWRHAYQFELDIRRAPMGEVRITLADGSVHGFSQQSDDAFRSTSLRSWRIEHEQGLIGSWTAYTASGTQYHFDYAGRLMRITTVQGQTLTLESLPASYLEAFGASYGVVVLEHHGRRIELYANDARQIIAMRGVQGRVTRYTYDDTGRLVNVDYIGEAYRASYQYGDAGMMSLDDVNSPYARQMSIEYNEQGQVSAYTDYPAGDVPQRYVLSYETGVSQQTWRVSGVDANTDERTMRWLYDDQMRLIRWVLPDPSWSYQWRYAQDSGLLNEIVQPTRAILRMSYDQYGYLTQFTDPLFGSGVGSYRLSYEDGAQFTRRLIAVDTPSISNWLTFGYDERNQLITLTRALSGTGAERQTHQTSYNYNGRGQLRQIIEPAGADGALRVTDYTYDNFGYPRLIRQGSPEAIDTNAPERLWRVQHDGVGRLLSITDTDGQIIRVQWHPDRELIDAIVQGDNTYQYAYDVYDNLTLYQTPTESESYQYDAQNRLITRTDALERLTTYQYDSVGNLLAVIAPDVRQTTRYQYDVLDHLIAQTDGAGFTTRYQTALNTESNRISYHIINPLEERTSYVHDTLGRLRQVIDADRNERETYRYLLTYNARGNLIELDDDRGQGRTLTYDFASNLLTTTLNSTLTTRYEYDEGLRLASVTAPDGASTTYAYDRYDNPIRATLPEGGLYRYVYDQYGRLTRITDPNDHTTRYAYEADRSAITVRLPDDAQVIYQYDSAGNLLAITDPRDSNNRTEYQYDAINRLLAEITPNGATTRYEYDERDLLTRIVAPNDLTTNLTYDPSGRIVARVQPDERETLYERDALGRIISTTNSLGQTTLYAYNVIGEIGRITNPNGQSEFFSWFSNGRIARYAGSSGIEYEYVYDRVGRLIEIVDLSLDEERAINTRYSYDDAGRIVSVRQGTRTTITTDEASVHRYNYDAQGNLTRYHTPESAIPYQMQYDDAGNRTLMIDPLGNITRYQYDAQHNVIAITHASGTANEFTEQFSYDLAGNITRSLTIDGVERLYSYDASDRLIALTERASASQTRTYRFTYNSVGDVNSITNPDGQVTAYRYDLFGNLVAIEQTRSTADDTAQTLTTRYQYDAFDNLTSVQAPVGQIHNMTYIGVDRRVRYVDAVGNGWSYNYDELGNVAQISNPLGYTQFLNYDLANRLVQQTDELGAVTRFGYDVRGHLAQVILPPIGNSNAREQIDYQFDRAGQLIGITHGADNRQTFTRDALGQITGITHANGEIVTITYDERGRIVTLNTDAQQIDRTYDANGQLATISDGQTQIALDYDGYGQLTQFMLGADITDDENASVDLSASYRYDENGHLIERDTGVYGTQTITYDAFNRPIAITLGEQSVQIAYNENGWRTRLIRSNGIETRYSYDNNGRVRTIVHLDADEVRLVGFAYEYDAIGNLTRLTRSDNWSKLYSYDNARQLISERWLDENNQIIYSVNYTYDEAGNRIEQIEQIGRGNQTRTLYEYNNRNQLTAEFQDVGFELEDRFSLPFAFPFVIVLGMPMWRLLRRRRWWLLVIGAGILLMMPLLQSAQAPTISYEYDNIGNLIAEVHQNGTTTSYQYDALNRLIAVERQVGDERQTLTQIRYNPQGHVAEIIEGDQHQRLLYDAFGLVAVQDVVTQQITRHLAPVSDETLLVIEDDRAFWTLDDGLGQISRFIADDTRSAFDVGTGFSTNAFQQVIASPDGTADSPARDLLEQVYLPQSDLILMGVRAYHPRIGRFLQRDWVRHDPRGNLYTFAYNSPLHYTDRTGMTPDNAFDGIAPDVAQVQPSDFITAPIMSDFDVPGVADQQAQENHRIVQLAYMAEYHNNETALAVDHHACDLYLHSVNPISSDARAQLGMSRQAMSALYHPERGWLPAEQPNLHSNRPDLAPFDHVWVLLARSQQGGIAFGGCPPTNPRPKMPDLNPAQRFDQLRAIREQLNEVPMLAVIHPANDAIPVIDAQSILPTVTLTRPQLSASVAEVGQVDQLRLDTRAFFGELLLPQFAPEPFRWQQRYQAQSVAPMQALIIRQ